jgi:hypothetical protein
MITEIPQPITCFISTKSENISDRAAPGAQAPGARPPAHHAPLESTALQVTAAALDN